MEAAGSQAKDTPTRRPIIMENLGTIISEAQLAMPWYDASLMRAIFLLAFHACAHIGEWLALMGNYNMQSMPRMSNWVRVGYM